MSETEKESLEKEFELERVILFSDAVFAIAITLLALEIKFPALPENLNNQNVFTFLWPTIIHFIAFIASFIFIGQSWARHLTLCKFLKQYNNKVIFLNLLLLFFIVTFPFSISAFIENVQKIFFVAIFTYVLNIFFVTLAQFIFIHYVLKTNTSLVTAGKEDEKRYFYIKSKYSFIVLLTAIVVLIVTTIISNGNPKTVGLSLNVVPIFSIIMQRRLKKYKPAKTI